MHGFSWMASYCICASKRILIVIKRFPTTCFMSKDQGLITNHSHLLFLCGRITHPYPHCMLDLAIAQVQFKHGWVFISQYLMTMYLIAHALPLMTVKLISLSKNAPGWSFEVTHRTAGHPLQHTGALATQIIYQLSLLCPPGSVYQWYSHKGVKPPWNGNSE